MELYEYLNKEWHYVPPGFSQMSDNEIIHYWMGLCLGNNYFMRNARQVSLAKIKLLPDKRHLIEILERMEKEPRKYIGLI